MPQQTAIEYFQVHEHICLHDYANHIYGWVNRSLTFRREPHIKH